jgi:hypothetical protein
MKKTPLFLAAFVFAFFPAIASAENPFSTITTLSGKVYTNCQIYRRDPDGVVISHQNGGAKLLFIDLPSEFRDALGYDAAKVAAYEKDLMDLKKTEQEAQWKHRTEVAKAQIAAQRVGTRRANTTPTQSMAVGGYGGYAYPVIGYGGYGYTTYGGTLGHRVAHGVGPDYTNSYGVTNSYGLGTGRVGYAGLGYGYNGISGSYNLGNRNLYTTRTPLSYGTISGFGTAGALGRNVIAPRPICPPIINAAACRPNVSLGGRKH